MMKGWGRYLRRVWGGKGKSYAHSFRSYFVIFFLSIFTGNLRVGCPLPCLPPKRLYPGELKYISHYSFRLTIQFIGLKLSSRQVAFRLPPPSDLVWQQQVSCPPLPPKLPQHVNDATTPLLPPHVTTATLATARAKVAPRMTRASGVGRVRANAM